MGVNIISRGRAVADNHVVKNVTILISAFCLLVFPVSSTVLPVIPGIIIGLIVISSLLLYFMRYGRVQKNTREERLFYFSIIFVVTFAFLITILSGMDFLSIKKLGKFIYLLMAIPVYFYFRTAKINYAWFWYGLVFGVFISGLVGFYEVYNDIFRTGYYGRAKGATHPIIFGDLTLLMGVMTLAGWDWFNSQSRWHLILPILAVLSGVFASILSQSRGAWISVPVLVVVILWFYTVKASKLKSAISLAVITVALMTMYFVPQTGLKHRIDETVTNIQAYVDADDKSRSGWSSVASRFEMWRTSWLIFMENPVIGSGWDGYQKEASKFVKSGEVSSYVVYHNHPHNQFISAMVSGGVLGLIAFLVLFYIPIRIFINVIKSSDASKETQQIALAGLLFVIGYAVFNLSESLFERSRPIAFFVFYLAVCMAGIQQDKELSINLSRESS